MVTYFDVTIAISCPHCYKWLCLVTVAPFHRPLYFLFSPFLQIFSKCPRQIFSQLLWDLNHVQPDTWGLKFVSYLKDGTQSPPPSAGGQRGGKLQLKVGLKFLSYPKDTEFTTLRLRADGESCNLTQGASSFCLM